MINLSKSISIKALYWTLVLVILDIATICVISGIYIGYVSAKAYEVASLEKWGIKITAPANTLEKSYLSQDGETITVHSHSDYAQIIEPGNETNLGHFIITGTPSDKIDIACTSKIEFDHWYIDEADTVEYCPIVFTIGKDIYRLSNDIYTLPAEEMSDNVHLYSQIEDFERGVENAIKEMYERKGTYTNNGDTWDILYDDVVWNWEYYENDTYDQYDTILGNRQVLPTIDVYINLRIEWDDGKQDNPISQDTLSGGPTDDTDQTSDSTADNNDVVESDQVPLAQLQSDEYTIIEDEPVFTSYKVPTTGDDFKAVFWISLLVISATVIVAMVILLFKRKKGQPDGNEKGKNIK